MKNITAVSFLLILTQVVNAQDLSGLYESVIQSVVKINTQERVENLVEGYVSTEEGLGSGVLIDESGLILTASHVVQTANRIMVEFEDGEIIPGDVVSSVPVADVALVKLAFTPKNRKAVPLGDSDDVKIGRQIMMVGAPLGLDFSLSIGHISGRHINKRFTNGQKWIEFLQTDASINPGNSGGPMFNMDGEVVGIASYILSESGGFEGLGFAATSNICKALLLEGKSPWTGVEGIILPEGLAYVLNVPQTTGILIQKVTALSPAYMMGLKGGQYTIDVEGESFALGGDIILEANGIKVVDESSLEEITLSLRTKENLTLKVLRGGEIITLEGNLKN